MNKRKGEREKLLYFYTLNLMLTMDHLRQISFHPIPSTSCLVHSHDSFKCTRIIVNGSMHGQEKMVSLFFRSGHLMTISSIFIRLSHKTLTIVNISEPYAHTNKNNAILRLKPIFCANDVTLNAFFLSLLSIEAVLPVLALQRFLHLQ